MIHCTTCGYSFDFPAYQNILPNLKRFPGLPVGEYMLVPCCPYCFTILGADPRKDKP